MLTRREAIKSLAGGLAAAWLSPASPLSGSEKQTTGLGLVIYDCRLRRQWLRKNNPQLDLFAPLTFLKYCRRVGAGGMQARLGVLQEKDAGRLRDYAEKHSLFIDAIVNPPNDEADAERFDAEICTAAKVGVQAARTVIMPGRRYERFRSLAEFRKFEQRGRKMLESAAPIVEKHRVPLGVENHKDQRIEERVALFEHLGSEYIGACVDTGNSFALLDDPYGAVEALAPYAFTVHLKDQAVREYDDGFLLGDVPLGEGCFDLRRMVGTFRRVKPQVRMALELITRDPLKVPCLTEAYWATLPDVPGRDLARTLRIVREHPAQNLQQVSTLPLKEQVELEDANVAQSLKYARERLKL